jgi:N-acetylated-alpha-linked acidic dipeptidase
LKISALGSGSDYTPFLQHLGIATLNLGFGGEDEGGSYHSIYDSIAHYERFGDPGFDYGMALAQVGGRTVLRLAEAGWLPIVAKPLSDTIGQYVKEVAKLADTERETIDERNRNIRERTFVLAADPKESYAPPAEEAPAPFLNLAPLQTASERFATAAARFDAAVSTATNRARSSGADASRRLDDVLRTLEAAFKNDRGLPRRPWFTHTIYAPGFYTGYGVKTLPGVREAIEHHNWSEAEAQAAQAAEAITRATAVLDRATAVVTGSD